MYSAFNIAATVIVSVLCLLSLILDVYKIYCDKKGFDAKVFVSLKNTNNNKISDFINKYWYVFATVIVIAFLYTRLKDLGVLPMGFHIDELGMLHDAISLAECGTDRFGHSWPVYLRNYGGGMGPMYAYLTSVVIRVLPITLRNIRLTGVAVSLVGLIASFALGTEITKQRYGGILTAFLFTSFPSIMMMNRWDCDCHLFISLTTISLTLLIYAINREKLIWYVMASLACGVTTYTYLIACLVFPTFLVLLVAWLLWTKRLTVKKFFALFIPVVVVATPLLVIQLVNMGLIAPFSLWGSDFFEFSRVRVGETSLSNMPNSIGVMLPQLIHGDKLSYNAFTEFGAIYTFCIPLILYGLIISGSELVMSVRLKCFRAKAFAFLFTLVGYLVALTHPDPNLNRYQEMFVAFVMIMMIAIVAIGRHLQWISVLIAGLAVIGFVLFSRFYFVQQADVYGYQFLFADPDAYNAVFFVTNFVDPAREKRVYVQLPYDKEYLHEEMISTAGHVSNEDWQKYNNKETENNGRFYFGFPEEFDENEDAVYILGREWDHISDYLISIGFNCDESIQSMRILWR